MDFRRVPSLPPYVFAVTEQLKLELRRAGSDVVDLGFGNPDLASPPAVVEKLVEAAAKPHNHRYSASRGIPKLRSAICDLYRDRFGVELDPETQAVATIGAKEGLAHLMWVLVQPGDAAVVPAPAYPIHLFAPVLAGASVIQVELGGSNDDLYDRLADAFAHSRPRPRALIVSFPHNPTTRVVDLGFMERLVALAREQRGARRARLRLRRRLLRRVPAAFDPPGARRRRGRGRDVLAHEVVLDGRLARRLRARQRAGAGGARAAEVLPRLRNLPADPDRLDRRAERGARLSRRGVRDLPQAPQRPLRRAGARRLARRASARDDVRLGADPGALPGARLARVRGQADARGARRGEPRSRVRPRRRGVRALRARRERAADRPGRARNPAGAAGAGSGTRRARPLRLRGGGARRRRARPHRRRRRRRRGRPRG